MPSVDPFSTFFIFLEVIIIVFYGIFTDYDDEVSAEGNSGTATVDHYYPFFQDVHVMIFIGFGFLMTFLKKYGFSAVGLNMLLAAFTIQFSILSNGFFHRVIGDHYDFHDPISLNIETLITGDFAAGAVLITFGALLGKAEPMQLLLIAVLEVIFYGINESLGVEEFMAVDMGGSMYVHTFGAYFGLATSYMLTPEKAKGHPDNGSDYKSDMFAMIGTLFLWMFWPSFNGALASSVGNSQHRVIINTVLALTGSCMSGFFASRLLRPEHKFDMVDIQNATLAGGVAVGSSADLVIGPEGALIVGFIAGFVSVIGYVYITPFMEAKIGLHDTCGVNNLHGMPGIIGGIGGAISAATADDSVYGDSISLIFAARAEDGENRTASEQGGYQALALVVTLAISIGGGLISGFIARNVTEKREENEPFNDKAFWEIPHEGYSHPSGEVEMRHPAAAAGAPADSA